MTTPRRSRARSRRGAVMLETLVALFPVLVALLGATQIGLLAAAQLVVQHAAVAGARSASVVLEENPPDIEAARRAVLARLGALEPRDPSANAELTFTIPPYAPDTIRVDVTYRARCSVPIARVLACTQETEDGPRVKVLRGEASMPRFAAEYVYGAAGASGSAAP